MHETTFKDHFSGGAADYTRFRPGYPPELFAWLADQCAARARAWDCGCGSGQAAVLLARHFAEVVASDPSAAQIANATRHERIRYSVAAAEDSGLATASIDLIVVAQALHWFDFARFYAEVRRVARPGGVLAALSYGPLTVDGPAAPVIARFYHDLIAPYWPPERRHVDAGYTTIPFPFTPVAAPPFAMETRWNMAHLIGYLGTWSAVKEYRQALGHDPLALIAGELTAAWGDPTQPRTVRWPLTLLVGRIGAGL